jgi:hypothetical protein
MGADLSIVRDIQQAGKAVGLGSPGESGLVLSSSKGSIAALRVARESMSEEDVVKPERSPRMGGMAIRSGSQRELQIAFKSETDK